jgi:hypothetical protein
MKEWWEEFSEVCDNHALGWAGILLSVHYLACAAHKVVCPSDEKSEEDIRQGFLYEVRHLARKIVKILENETLSDEMKVKVVTFGIAYGILELERRKKENIMRHQRALRERIFVELRSSTAGNDFMPAIVSIIDDEMRCGKTGNWI